MEAQAQAQSFTVERNSCTMLIVADYRFYKDHSIDLAPPAVIQTLVSIFKNILTNRFKNIIFRIFLPYLKWSYFIPFETSHWLISFVYM